jgi:hypothetical protein
MTAVPEGWVEPFAKSITVVANMMGIAWLNLSYAPNHHRDAPRDRGNDLMSAAD